MERSSRQTGTASPDDRSMAPLVAIILLFGMVFLGATIVSMSGSVLVESLESDAEADNVRLVAQDGDHCISTSVYAGSDSACAVTMDPPGAFSTTTDDGELSVTWWSDEGTETTVDVAPLGAIEHRLDDRTIANQAGGVWEVTDDGDAFVRSAPNIGYDGETLSLGVVSATTTEYGGGDATIRSDANRSTALEAQLRAAALDGGENVTIEVTSEQFHTAWERHFETAFEGENVEITSNDDETTVSVTVTNVTDVTTGSHIVVDEDLGLETHPDRFVEAGDDVTIDGRFANIGGLDGESTVGLAIAGDTVGSEAVSLDGGSTTTESVSFSPADLDLEVGQTHQYELFTDDDRTDTPGEFYYGVSGSELVVDETNASTDDDGDVTITAAVRNVGLEPGSEDVELEVDGPDDAEYGTHVTEAVERAPGEQSEVSWTLNRSHLVNGDHEYTVRVSDTDETGTFAVDSGVDPGDTDLEFNYDTDVTVSVLATETSFASNVQGDGTADSPYREYRLPIHAEIVTQDLETGEEVRDEPWQNDRYGTANLNIHDERETTWSTSIDVEANTRMTITGTSYECRPWNVDFPSVDHWELAETNQFDGDPNHDGGEWPDGGAGYWEYYDCAAYDVDNPWHTADATSDTDDPQVRVRNAVDNEMPVLRGANPRQQSADEFLDDHGLYSGDESADGTPLLDLDDNEFVFLYEVTEAPRDGLFEEALNRDADNPYGDPNFNDMVVYVEVGELEPELDVDDDPGSGSGASPGQGNSSPSEPPEEDLNIDVDTGHIVIG